MHICAARTPSLCEVQEKELAQIAHNLGDVTAFFERGLCNDPRRHLVKHLVEHVTQLVHDVILRAIDAVHTVIGAFAFIFFVIFTGVVEAWGVSQLLRASVHTRHVQDKDSANLFVTQSHSFLNENTQKKKRSKDT